MAPVDVNSANVDVAFGRLFHNEKSPSNARFAVGDHVRTAIQRKDFHRGFAPQFGEQVFVIRKRLRTNPPTYLLSKLNGKEIRGALYEQQLLPVFIMPNPEPMNITAANLETETDD